MRGRKPIPTKLKMLHGNPGKRRINKREPKPSAEIPACPSWLSPRAVAEWNRLAPELAQLGLLTGVDIGVLGAYCSCVARWSEAEEWITAHGTVAILRTDKGAVSKLMLAPQVSVSFQALRELRQLAGELGLSPSSRTRLDVKPPAAEPPNRFAMLDR